MGRCVSVLSATSVPGGLEARRRALEVPKGGDDGLLPNGSHENSFGHRRIGSGSSSGLAATSDQGVAQKGSRPSQELLKVSLLNSFMVRV